MIGFVTGIAVSAVLFVVMAALGDMVSEEVRDRLDHVPHAILRLAAKRLDAEQSTTLYDDEWMPELTFILKGDEARPITRLYHGTRFALGILAAVPQFAAELGKSRLTGVSALLVAATRIGTEAVEAKLLTTGIFDLERDLALASKQLDGLRTSQATAFIKAFRYVRLRWKIRAAKSGLIELRTEKDVFDRKAAESGTAIPLNTLFRLVLEIESLPDWELAERKLCSRSKSRLVRRMSRQPQLTKLPARRQ